MSITTTSSTPPPTTTTTTTNINLKKPSTIIGRKFIDLFNSQKYTDCTFQIDDIKINCHKLILSAISPVFEAMLYGPMSTAAATTTTTRSKTMTAITKKSSRINSTITPKINFNSTIKTNNNDYKMINNSSGTGNANNDDHDENDDDNNCIKIIDINPDIFQIMIEYCYTGEINYKLLTIENLLELYYCSEKYLIDTLIDDCLNEIQKKLKYKNILQCIDICYLMNLESLLKILINFFYKYCINMNNNNSYSDGSNNFNSSSGNSSCSSSSSDNNNIYNITNNQNNLEFIKNLEQNYYHITKDCLKFLLNNIKNIKNNINLTIIIWFIKLWCKNECKLLNINENEYKNQIFKDLNTIIDYDIDSINNYDICKNVDKNNDDDNDNINNCCNNSKIIQYNGKLYIPIYLERIYYKPCKPFIINDINYEFITKLKTDNFITLLGITIHSRILSKIKLQQQQHHQQFDLRNNNNTNFYKNYYLNRIVQQQQQSNTRTINDNDNNTNTNNNSNNNNCYTESFDLEIISNNCLLIYKQKIYLPKTFYNSLININLNKFIILSNDSIYDIKLIWNNTITKYAEYPLNLYSDELNGIKFLDNIIQINSSNAADNSNNDDGNDNNNENNFNYSYYCDNGGIIKGIKYLNET